MTVGSAPGTLLTTPFRRFLTRALLHGLRISRIHSFPPFTHKETEV